MKSEAFSSLEPCSKKQNQKSDLPGSGTFTHSDFKVSVHFNNKPLLKLHTKEKKCRSQFCFVFGLKSFMDLKGQVIFKIT